MAERFRANSPRFVDETVDGESLIMDMVKGTYYSCVGASALAWNELKSGASATELAGVLSAEFGVDRVSVVADIERFLGVLVDDEALVPDDDATAAPGRRSAVVIPRAEYTPLERERFTDLADLILLDPVHDVTDAGWPHRAE